MPKYFYKCLEEGCEEVFEIVHSMKNKLQTCSQCSTSCEKEGNIERVPMNIITMLKKNIKNRKTHCPGSLVKKNIEEFRETLKEEKKRLQEVEHK
jgi:hypothetical protein